MYDPRFRGWLAQQVDRSDATGEVARAAASIDTTWQNIHDLRVCMPEHLRSALFDAFHEFMELDRSPRMSVPDHRTIGAAVSLGIDLLDEPGAAVQRRYPPDHPLWVRAETSRRALRDLLLALRETLATDHPELASEEIEAIYAIIQHLDAWRDPRTG